MFDKRLLKLATDAMRAMVASVGLRWLSLIAQVLCLFALWQLFGSVLQQSGWGEHAPSCTLLLALVDVVAYYLFRMGAARFALKAGSRAKAKVTQLAFDKLVRLGATRESVMSTSEAAQIVGEGSEHIRAYFSNYLPQFFYAVLAPLTLFVITLFVCAPAAFVMLLCVLLMPMSIIVLMKRARKFLGSYWGTYVDLGASFMDAVRGLTTLKVYGADARAHERLNEQAEGFRAVTMRLLRVQLNSITLLDLFTYGGIAVGALVALALLTTGALQLQDALLVLLLAPLFFLPMRSFGSQFHTGMNANEVIESFFKLLEAPEPQRGQAEADLGNPTISCSRLSISYDGKNPALEKVDYEVAPLTFSGLTGASGSGKSTLLRVLAGQLPNYEGSVRLCGVELCELSQEALSQTVTVLSHESHVFKGTVRSNLQLGKPAANDYEMWEALRKARLDDFIIAFGGLSAELAEDGANLSGGQRQRLCFARAILRDTPIYLFDEAASSVDAESEKLLLTVIQELSLTKTVVCATHRLASLRSADEVYVLDEGRMVEHGTHYSLMHADGSVYRKLWERNAQLEEFATAADGIVVDDTYEPNEVDRILDKLPQQAAQMMYAALMARDALKYKRQVEGDAYDPVTLGHPAWIPLPDSYRSAGEAKGTAEDAGKKVREEQRAEAPGQSAFTVISKLAKVTANMRGSIVLSVVLGVLSNLAAALLPVCALVAFLQVAGVFDPGVQLAVLIVAMVCCGVLRGPLRYAERLMTHDLTFKTLATVRDKVFGRLRILAPARLEAKDSGDLIALLTSDIEQLEGFYSRSMTPVLSAMFTVLACCVLCVVGGSWWHALIYLLGSVVIGVCVPVLSTRISRSKARDLRAFAVNMTTFLLDSLRGLDDLLQCGRAHEYVEEMEAHLGTLSGGDDDVAKTRAAIAPLARLLALTGALVALLVSGAQVAAGALAPAQAALLSLLVLVAFEPVVSVAGLGFSLSRTLACAERVLAVLDEKPEAPDIEQGVELGEFSGAQMRGVSFAYQAAQPVLSTVDLEVPTGSLVRVTGKSGAGKSTLLKLFMRFWDAHAGSVELSGADVRTVNTASLRSAEAYMTQDTYLFEGTLRDNLCLAGDVDDEAILQLLARVQLDGLIERLPAGLDTQVGGADGRGLLSAGERQRVGLARALLHNAPFLLLDEPTSNLDSLSEAAVLQALAATTLDRTVVVVSHRRAVAALADATYIVHKAQKRSDRNGD